MNEKIKDAVIEFYMSLPDEVRFSPATEEQLQGFERKYRPIPSDYRWFLSACGGGVVGAEWVDGIQELPKTHDKFAAESAISEGWTMRNVFIIGWDGSGNPFGICEATGKVLVEDHDLGGTHEMASSFEAFIVEGYRINEKP
jgi:hypothetical protein